MCNVRCPCDSYIKAEFVNTSWQQNQVQVRVFFSLSLWALRVFCKHRGRGRSGLAVAHASGILASSVDPKLRHLALPRCRSGTCFLFSHIGGELVNSMKTGCGEPWEPRAVDGGDGGGDDDDGGGRGFEASGHPGHSFKEAAGFGFFRSASADFSLLSYPYSQLWLWRGH